MAGLRNVAWTLNALPECAQAREMIHRHLKLVVTELEQVTAFSERENPGRALLKAKELQTLLRKHADPAYVRAKQMMLCASATSKEWHFSVVGDHLRANFARTYGLAAIEHETLLATRRRLAHVATQSKKADDVEFISRMFEYYTTRSALLDLSMKLSWAPDTVDGVPTAGAPCADFVMRMVPIARSASELGKPGDAAALEKQFQMLRELIDAHRNANPDDTASEQVISQTLLLFSHISEYAQQHDRTLDYTEAALVAADAVEKSMAATQRQPYNQAEAASRISLIPLLASRASMLRAEKEPKGRQNEVDLKPVVTQLRNLASSCAEPVAAIELRRSAVLRHIARTMQEKGNAVQAEGFLGGARTHASNSIVHASQECTLVEAVEEFLLVEEAYTGLLNRITINDKVREGDLFVSDTRSEMLRVLVPEHVPRTPGLVDDPSLFVFPQSILSDIHRVIEQQVFPSSM
ncbi:hypothetical protein FVE85_9039 [Porphyridium purpureum]|uniref:Uncharacterized protein n=1 Tax=Porphyridium purpureum TaxID=35688 RepID=A0A5J4YQU6_PORPP|nr:hypothetical protein FVE85_9039 [Porphyridium purpureum]|eukprot:POR6387..scf222_8